jgi:hypothetical protein
MSCQAFAGLGLVATEIFRYNRQNFAFDQDQRFNRASDDRLGPWVSGMIMVAECGRFQALNLTSSDGVQSPNSFYMNITYI